MDIGSLVLDKWHNPLVPPNQLHPCTDGQFVDALLAVPCIRMILWGYIRMALFVVCHGPFVIRTNLLKSRNVMRKNIPSNWHGNQARIFICSYVCQLFRHVWTRYIHELVAKYYRRARKNVRLEIDCMRWTMTCCDKYPNLFVVSKQTIVFDCIRLCIYP